MVDQIDRDLCTGCKMCADICPKKAIRYEEDKQGFWFPVVNKETCINCSLCLSKCIVNHTIKVDNKRIAYAAWSKDDHIRINSTSGGVYYELASAVLDMNGYLVGSVYAENYQSAYHIISNKKEDLSRICGSKYFQSDTSGIFEKTKKILDEGNTVLFTGTPCHIHALKNYLGKDYDGLLTLDFICRGVPSPLLQKKKIEYYEKKWHSKVKSYRDKSKYIGWEDFGEYITFQNGRKVFISRWEDHINNCFIEKNLNIRESCYRCRFKEGNNASDLTMGDYWGVNKTTIKDSIYGVSALIANTEKGDSFINSIRNKLYLDRTNLIDIEKGNPAYVKAAKRPDSRGEFFNSIIEKGLIKTIRKFTHLSIKQRLKIHYLKALSHIKKYIPLIKKLPKVKFWDFVRYNFFAHNIKRDKGCFIIPLRGAIIYIDKNATIELHGNLILNNYPNYKKGNYQARLRLYPGSQFIVRDDVNLAYGGTLSLDKNAKLTSGRLLTGINDNIICAFNISIGNRVMFGRNVCVFDSDYHPVYNDSFERINEDKKVVIEDNCWVGANSTILKGSNVKHGAIVSANSIVLGDVEGDKVFINKREPKSIGNDVFWRY